VLGRIPDINTLVYTTVTLKNEETSIFEKLIPQRYYGEVTIFDTFAKKGIIQYHLSVCKIWMHQIILWKVRRDILKIRTIK